MAISSPNRGGINSRLVITYGFAKQSLKHRIVGIAVEELIGVAIRVIIEVDLLGFDYSLEKLGILLELTSSVIRGQRTSDAPQSPFWVEDAVLVIIHWRALDSPVCDEFGHIVKRPFKNGKINTDFLAL